MKQTLMAFSCPRYASFPAVGLYLEQVLWLLNDSLGPLLGGGSDRSVTGTMVNNYVKQKLLPAPKRKLYTREHMARLTMLCLFKQAFSIPEIADAFKLLCPAEEAVAPLYDTFCELMEQTLRNTVQGKASPFAQADLLHAMVTAVANKLYARMLLDARQEAAQ
ncbi:MAG: DUF1836 domain-containing protein [Clostridia bacterium]|nr:DUF1836 domain-containing protein [Clostridia bacterium]